MKKTEHEKINHKCRCGKWWFFLKGMLNKQDKIKGIHGNRIKGHCYCGRKIIPYTYKYQMKIFKIKNNLL